MATDSLESFVEEVNGSSHLRVEHDFGDGFVRLRTSEAERRQAAQDIRCVENIVLELLRNSRDAHATRIYVAMSREGEKRLLTVVDDGDGIPESMHAHVFEPRVTSKLDTSHMDAWGMHGRRMALYSISVNSEKALVETSGTGLGCSIGVVADTKRLPEKTDQSSFPTFLLGEENNVAVRGPRNILRTACEFAIEARRTCTVHVGSPAEVAASLFYYGSSTLSTIERAFCRDANQLPLVKRLGTAGDPETLSELASQMGLVISERTARRIMNGEIAAADSILDLVEISRPERGAAKGGKRGKNARKPVKLDKSDTGLLKAAVKDAYAEIAERYYLESGVEPSVRVKGDKITISVPVVRAE